ncbi:hypothetical protein ABW636_11415 [Aquimarina sp. 2201CG1-2-11]|uniref:hypothetical protein n=1 Tax=Aquimarina discodermiae TaxID=3231043 RepID=UPI0034634770
MTESDLDSELEKLQSESVNNGGTWRFLRLPIIQNKEDLKEFFKTIDIVVNMDSVNNKKVKKIIEESIDHWSLYSGPCPERTENSKEFDKLKIDFVKNLFRLIEEQDIIDIYRVENIDLWLNKVIESGIDHMNEDFIFQTNEGNYILHLGFSS